MRLTRDEMVLIAGLCLALVAGAVVKHYRDSRRVMVLQSQEKAGAKPGIVSSTKNP